MSVHHTDAIICPMCEAKLLTAHEYFGPWFRAKKKTYINLHISCSDRNMADQEKAYSEGKTRCHYPNSPHNNMKDGKPYSLALDLFQIDDDGVARFSPMFYAKLNAENKAANEPILCGIEFKSLGDSDHFQYSPKVDRAA